MKQAIEGFRIHRRNRHERGDASAESTRSVESRIRRIETYFRCRQCWFDISLLTHDDIAGFLHYSGYENLAHSYASNILADLRAIVRLAMSQGRITTDPTRGFRVCGKRPSEGRKLISLQDFVHILFTVPTEFWMMLLLIRCCGLRAREASELRMSDIDLDRRTLTVRSHRSGRLAVRPESGGPDAPPGRGSVQKCPSRVIPIAPILLPIIRWWIDTLVAQPGTGYVDPNAVFAWPDPATHGRCLSRLQTTWRAAVLSTGLSATTERGRIEITINALRCSFACDLLVRSTIPRHLVAYMLGQQSGSGLPGPLPLENCDAADLAAMGTQVGDCLVAASEAGDVIQLLLEHLQRHMPADAK
ncbi:MAG: tyrosine-type recombinase/integrase [Actinomycetota bacterium]|nr:tyrosine-type recombinase/integrase [Actinomycetota bacterium]